MNRRLKNISTFEILILILIIVIFQLTFLIFQDTKNESEILNPSNNFNTNEFRNSEEFLLDLDLKSEINSNFTKIFKLNQNSFVNLLKNETDLIKENFCTFNFLLFNQNNSNYDLKRKLIDKNTHDNIVKNLKIDQILLPKTNSHNKYIEKVFLKITKPRDVTFLIDRNIKNYINPSKIMEPNFKICKNTFRVFNVNKKHTEYQQTSLKIKQDIILKNETINNLIGISNFFSMSFKIRKISYYVEARRIADQEPCFSIYSDELSIWQKSINIWKERKMDQLCWIDSNEHVRSICTNSSKIKIGFYVIKKFNANILRIKLNKVNLLEINRIRKNYSPYSIL